MTKNAHPLWSYSVSGKDRVGYDEGRSRKGYDEGMGGYGLMKGERGKGWVLQVGREDIEEEQEKEEVSYNTLRFFKVLYGNVCYSRLVKGHSLKK